MPASNQSETFAAAVSEVTERMTVLVREEIELAKAEAAAKAKSLAIGAGVAIAGAVFGFFALIYGLLAVAWAINDATGHLWLGFVIVFGLITLLGVFSVLFAVRKLKAATPPVPTMAIEEAKRIRETVTTKTEISR